MAIIQGLCGKEKTFLLQHSHNLLQYFHGFTLGIEGIKIIIHVEVFCDSFFCMSNDVNDVVSLHCTLSHIETLDRRNKKHQADSYSKQECLNLRKESEKQALTSTGPCHKTNWA